MSDPDVAASATVRLHPSRDGRLGSYGAIALIGFAGSAAFGQPTLAALAVPFALALALGLRRSGPVEVRARMVIDSDQVLEGDELTGHLLLEWDGTFDAQILLHRVKGMALPASAERSWSVPEADSARLPIHLQATRWGTHAVGEVWLQLRAPFGLVWWTGKVMTGPSVRVLPGEKRLNRLLDPPDSRAVWGMHRSSRVGEGHEFAALHPYVPGDRLRDLNWAATARWKRPFVNRYHPELSGDVVIAVDALDDASTGSQETLARAARIAWTLASLHLRANDRVGMVGLGVSTQWLSPGGGRLARYQLLDALLRIGGEAADPMSLPGRRWRVPAAGLTIVLTPLQDPATSRALASWRARGRSLAVIVVDAVDDLGPAESSAQLLARRVWSIELQRRARELGRMGIPVVSAPAGGPLTPTILALRRSRRLPFMRRGR